MVINTRNLRTLETKQGILSLEPTWATAKKKKTL